MARHYGVKCKLAGGGTGRAWALARRAVSAAAEPVELALALALTMAGFFITASLHIHASSAVAAAGTAAVAAAVTIARSRGHVAQRRVQIARSFEQRSCERSLWIVCIVIVYVVARFNADGRNVQHSVSLEETVLYVNSNGS